jgi:hypothetical protein
MFPMRGSFKGEHSMCYRQWLKQETVRGETPVPMIGAWRPGTVIRRVVRRTRDNRSCSTYTTGMPSLMYVMSCCVLHISTSLTLRLGIEPSLCAYQPLSSI